METPSGLDVAIIGGGIAGLAAARVLREFHNVTIYERNGPDALETGAAVGLGPNGSKMAKRLGLTRESMRGVVSKGLRSFDQEGTLLRTSEMNCAERFGSEWWMVHRQDLKSALLRAATSTDADLPGKPAKLLYNAEVTNANPASGEIYLKDGSTAVGDLIIGADGIHSKIRDAVLGQNRTQPVPANLSVYRFTLSSNVVESLFQELPPPLDFKDGIYLTTLVASDGSNRNVVIYPCRNMDVYNFACAVPDSMLKSASEESWTKDGDIEEMLDCFKDFPAWLHEIIKQLERVHLYQLRDADPLPTFVNHRTLLIGDAAHPMVPYQGQGAVQGLEDAEGLVLLNASGTGRDDVPGILEKWDSLRRPRASQVQLNSRVAAAKVSPEILIKRMAYNWTYDGILEAQGNTS